MPILFVVARRRRTPSLAWLLLASACGHAAWAAGTWYAVERLAPADDRRRSASLPVPPRPIVPQRPPEYERFGSNSGGEAALDREDDRRQIAEQFTQDQPLLGVTKGRPLPDAPPPAPPAAALDVASPLPTDAARPSELALALAPPPAAVEVPAPPPESKPTPPAPEIEPPPSDVGDERAPEDAPPMPDDRDSPPVQRDPPPETVVDARTGKTVGRDGVDFKPVGLRTGLTATIDRAFMPRGTRVVTRILVDDAGVPLTIIVTRGSGSKAVDEALRRSMFQWWFGADPSEPFTFVIVL